MNNILLSMQTTSKRFINQLQRYQISSFKQSRKANLLSLF